MVPSSRYCHGCGAANTAESQPCSACGQSLTGDEEAAQKTLLKDRYRLLVQVGTGGFGAVYKALDTHASDAIVAIKRINLDGLTPQGMIEATDGFHREVHLLSGLQHASLPRIRATFTDAQHWYLVMDFIEGETLETYLKRRFVSSQRQSLPVDEVLTIGVRLCPVLEYLHTRQPPIIFRDLKPSNVMRTPDGRLVLIDFGIARFFTPGKPKDTIPFGSPGYAAPEQYGKAQTTPQADIYSLGALLHHLLTGDDPAETPFHFALLGPQDSSTESALDRLIHRMVDVDASRRPASISEVREELESLARMQGQPRIWRPSELPPPLSPAAAQETYRAWQAQQQHIQAVAAKSSRRKFIIGALAVGGLTGFVAIPVLSHILAPPRFYGSAPFIPTPPPTPAEHLIYRGHTGPVTTVAWSPDGRFIASGSADKTVQVWRAADGALAYTFYGYQLPVTSLTWSDDSMCIASSGDSDGTVQVWEALNGHMDTTHEGQTGKVLALTRAFGTYLSGSADKTVQVWDSRNGKTVYTYRGHSGAVKAVLTFETDYGICCGYIIASAGADKTVQVWQTGEKAWGQLVRTYQGHSASVNALAGDSGVIASASDDGTVQVWDAVLGTPMMTYRGHGGKVNAVIWLPGSPSYIASAGDDKTVQVWERSSGELVYTYKRHFAPVRTLAYSRRFPNRIISGSDDGTLHLWTIPNV